MARKKKRAYSFYERESRPAQDQGLGRTLAHLRNQTPPPDQDTDISDPGEWQVVDRSAKRQKTKNYPGLGYSELHRLQTSVKLRDLQSLVLYCLADGTAPQWLSVKHHAMVKKAVVLFVPGLEKGMFDGSIALDAAKEGLDDYSQHTDGAIQPFTNNKGVTVNIADHVVNNAQSNRLPQMATNSPDDYLPTRLVADKLPPPLKPLADCFEYLWPVKAPGDDKMSKVFSPLQAMLQSPITRSQEEKREDKQNKGPAPAREGKNWENKRTPITSFFMTNEELRENEYVLHPACLVPGEETIELKLRTEKKQTATDGWADTRVEKLEDGAVSNENIQEGSLTAGRTILAMDCEMCTVQGGEAALTRISLVGWDGDTVMDELVKPDKTIIDYLTPYSGITPEKLDPITTSLQDIQTRLLGILTPQTVLVGHSLDSDLTALKMTHPFIVDTSILYSHPRGPPMKSSLKWLSQKYLSREIQKGHGTMGHNSVEDALACLDLVKIKCERGPQWGTSEATNESIFKRLKRATVPGGSNSEGRTGAIIDHDNPKKSFGQVATHCIGCTDDAEVVSGVQRAVLGDPDGSTIPGKGVDFTWARLHELEVLRGWWTDNRPNAAPPPASPSPGALAETVAQTVAHIKHIHDFLPPCTLLIVCSGTGDPREMARLQEMYRTHRQDFQTKKWDELSVKWTDVEAQALGAATKRARDGVGFVGIK